MGTDSDWGSLLLAGAVSYLLGSLPFSYWIARWRAGVDIRTQGSRNPGATNVSRVVGLSYGIMALALDLGKGAAAAGVTNALGAPIALAGMAVLGHDWSAFLRFSGGKGVATTVGLLAAVSWSAGLATVGTWALLVAWTRRVSVGSIVALLLAPLFLHLLRADLQAVALFAALGLLSLIRHRSNLRRLLRGEEPPVGSKA